MPPNLQEKTQPKTAEQLAQQITADLHRIVLAHEPGVLAGDIEAIHDMRVTVRRLRVALSNFAACLDAGGRKFMRAKLSDLADQLGAVRDLDVFIATLESRQAKLSSEHQPHLQNFVGRLRARRRRRQRQLAEYLRGADYTQLKHQFLALVQSSSAKPAQASDAPRTAPADAAQEGDGQAA